MEKGAAPVKLQPTPSIQLLSEEKLTLALCDALEDLSRVLSSTSLSPPPSYGDNDSSVELSEDFLLQTCQRLAGMINEFTKTTTATTVTAKTGLPQRQVQLKKWQDIQHYCTSLNYPPHKRKNRKSQFLEYTHFLALHMQTLHLLEFQQQQQQHPQRDHSETNDSKNEDMNHEEEEALQKKAIIEQTNENKSPTTTSPSSSLLLQLMKLSLPSQSSATTPQNNLEEDQLTSLLSQQYQHLSKDQLKFITSMNTHFQKDYDMRMKLMKQKFDLFIQDDGIFPQSSSPSSGNSAVAAVGSSEDKVADEGERKEESKKKNHDSDVLQQFILPSTIHTSHSVGSRVLKPLPSAASQQHSQKKTKKKNQKHFNIVDRGGRISSGDDRISMPTYIPTKAVDTDEGGDGEIMNKDNRNEELASNDNQKQASSFAVASCPEGEEKESVENFTGEQQHNNDKSRITHKEQMQQDRSENIKGTRSKEMSKDGGKKGQDQGRYSVRRSGRGGPSKSRSSSVAPPPQQIQFDDGKSSGGADKKYQEESINDGDAKNAQVKDISNEKKNVRHQRSRHHGGRGGRGGRGGDHSGRDASFQQHYVNDEKNGPVESQKQQQEDIKHEANESPKEEDNSSKEHSGVNDRRQGSNRGQHYGGRGGRGRGRYARGGRHLGGGRGGRW